MERNKKIFHPTQYESWVGFMSFLSFDLRKSITLGEEPPLDEIVRAAAKYRGQRLSLAVPADQYCRATREDLRHQIEKEILLKPDERSAWAFLNDTQNPLYN